MASRKVERGPGRSLLALVLVILSVVSATAQHGPAPSIDVSQWTDLRWRNIGPNRGGRSIAAAGSPSRPNEYYFGATGGGLWKTPTLQAREVFRQLSLELAGHLSELQAVVATDLALLNRSFQKLKVEPVSAR